MKDKRCPNCERVVPYDDFIKDGKCLWCDTNRAKECEKK